MTGSVALGHLYVVATTTDATRHALDMAETVATGGRCELTVIVLRPERVTVSSARAHVFDLPVDVEITPYATVEEVRDLIETRASHADVVVAPGNTARHLASITPSGATIVVCGPIHRFLEAPEQRLVRELTAQGFDVVFLPCREGPKDDEGPR